MDHPSKVSVEFIYSMPSGSITVFQGRRGDVWWWAATRCIRSLWLMYLVRSVAVVCELKMLNLMKLLGAVVETRSGPITAVLCYVASKSMLH